MGSRDATADARRLGAVDRRVVPAPAVVAGVLALATAAAPFVARLALNARAPVPVDLGTVLPVLLPVALGGPALAAGLLLPGEDDDLAAVGLAFLSVFGLFAAVAPAARIPAGVAVLCGGGLAVGRRLVARGESVARWRLLPALAVLAGVGLSLAAGFGVAPAARPAGATLAMLGAAGTPALLAHGSGDWALGGLVAGLLVAAGLSAPFLTAAVALVGGGVVATNLLVMAVGLCGLVTAASAAARSGRWAACCGVALLLVAGVPATLPRAVAAVVGLVLLVSAHRPSPGVDANRGVPA